MSSVLTDIGEFIVEFYNPVSHMVHSSVFVEAAAKDAVKEAIEIIARDYKEDVSRHRASIKNAKTGEGVVGVENIATKAQLTAQVEQLLRQINALDDDGSQPEYKQQVAATLPNPNPHVSAPPIFNPGFAEGEAPVRPPDPATVQAGQPVAQPPPAAAFKQSDLDAAIAQRQQEAGPAQ